MPKKEGLSPESSIEDVVNYFTKVWEKDLTPEKDKKDGTPYDIALALLWSGGVNGKIISIFILVTCNLILHNQGKLYFCIILGKKILWNI